MPILACLFGDAPVRSGKVIEWTSALLPKRIEQRARDAFCRAKLIDGVNGLRGIGVEQRDLLRTLREDRADPSHWHATARYVKRRKHKGILLDNPWTVFISL